MYICTGLLQSCHGVCIELQPVLFLSASWTLAGATELVSDVVIAAYSAVTSISPPSPSRPGCMRTVPFFEAWPVMWQLSGQSLRNS